MVVEYTGIGVWYGPGYVAASCDMTVRQLYCTVPYRAFVEIRYTIQPIARARWLAAHQALALNSCEP
jgi:hypothetical protein